MIKRAIPALFIFSLWAALFLPAAASAESGPAAAVAEALGKKLHQDPYWRTLCHYLKSSSGWESTVDDPRFFLCPAGKKDPQAELEATIRAFLSAGAPTEESPCGRFVARLAWLEQKLPDAPWPGLENAPAFKKWRGALDVQSVSLAFPSAYMNNPASMFGHTFLTLDSATGSRLLSHAVNYAANTKDPFGPAYAFRGIFGLYRGYYSLQPYYEKIAEYQDAGRRDIWEYRTNLDAAEINRLLLHVYELNGIYSDYYFFDENCSFGLLFLLDAARPGANLAAQAGAWVIPPDTLRLARKNGLVSDVRFRPSPVLRIRSLAGAVSAQGREAARQIAEGAADPADAAGGQSLGAERVPALNLAAEVLRYRYSEKALSKELYTERYLKILDARSALGGGEEEPDAPRPVPPDKGHPGARFFSGAGTDEGAGVAWMCFRPVFHGLDDDPSGYGPGTQILALDTRVRYGFDDGRWDLENLDLLNVVSIAPRDVFFKPVSWKFSTGLSRMTDPEGDRSLVWSLWAGRGWAFNIARSAMAYGFLLGHGAAGSRLERGYAAGPGAEAGVWAHAAGFWTIHLRGRAMGYFLGDGHGAFRAAATNTFSLNPNAAFEMEASTENARGFSSTQAWAGLSVYF